MTPPAARIGAALALAVAVCAAGPARAQSKKPPGPAAIEEAKKHMKAGFSFYQDGHKCEEALREFVKAYELSGSLNALKGMAICNLELERDADAIQGYTAYLAGKGATIDPAEKAQIEGDLNALKAAVATVKLGADRPGVRVTDVRQPAQGFPIRNTYALPDQGDKQLGLHPGQHVLTASLDGFPDQVWKVDLVNGGTFSHRFTFEKSATPRGPVAAVAAGPVKMIRPVPASVWVTTGLTGALAIAWGALAVRAKLENDSYARLNVAGSGQTATALASLRTGVKEANLLADVFLGATAAGLVTTLALYFSRPSKPSVPPPGSAIGLYLTPAAGISGAGVVLGGSF